MELQDPHFSQFLFSKLKEEPDYNPYCGRCPGIWGTRMKREEKGLWTHHCGARHDARADLKLLDEEKANAQQRKGSECERPTVGRSDEIQSHAQTYDRITHHTGSARPDAPIEIPPERTPNPEAEDGKPMATVPSRR